MSRRYDLVVVGGGTGGLVSADRAAGVGARVALIGRTGGDCLWTGCVPGKSLIAAASLAPPPATRRRRRPAADGPEIGFGKLMDHVWGAIRTIEPQDSPERLRADGVEVIQASGRVTGPGSIEANGRQLAWRSAQARQRRGDDVRIRMLRPP